MSLWESQRIPSIALKQATFLSALKGKKTGKLMKFLKKIYIFTFFKLPIINDTRP